MYYLLVYDISKEGKSENRLHKVAKVCENYGIRVQNSVFELNLQYKDLVLLKNQLSKIIDSEIDSIRIYELGKNYESKITLLGKREIFESTQDNGFFI